MAAHGVDLLFTSLIHLHWKLFKRGWKVTHSPIMWPEAVTMEETEEAASASSSSVGSAMRQPLYIPHVSAIGTVFS